MKYDAKKDFFRKLEQLGKNEDLYIPTADIKFDFDYFKDKMEIIKEIKQKLNEAGEAIKILTNGYGYEFCGHIILDHYIDLLAEVVGDKYEWIYYFVFECKFGESPLKVTIGNEEIMLDSIEKLWKVIKE